MPPRELFFKEVREGRWGESLVLERCPQLPRDQVLSLGVTPPQHQLQQGLTGGGILRAEHSSCR